MKLVQTMMALALAGAMAASAQAADTIYNMGTLSATPYINTVTVSAGSLFTLPSTGSISYNFTDTYNFSVADATVAGTAVTVNLDLGSVAYHISNLKLDLFDADDDNLVIGGIVSGPQDISVSFAAPVTAGNYYFKVRGFADGQGTDQGIYTFSAAAVPEAKSYAMMLAGLGLVGFVVLRRRTS